MAPGSGGPPRLIRARHHARWKEGTLEGNTELVVDVSGAGASVLEVDPWTPFIPAAPRDGASVVADGSGKTVLEFRPGHAGTSSTENATITLDWVLAARDETNGRRFELGLPGDETTVLSLDVPAGLIPLGPRGYRQGPLPSSLTGHQLWRFHGSIGLADLQLQDSRGDGVQGGATVWVSGPTKIDLGSPGERDAKLGNWRTDWSVQLDPRGVNQLVAVLDPGLELIGVSGPDVKSFQTRPDDAATRVVVTFSGSAVTTTKVEFEAHTRAPLEGSMASTGHATPGRHLDRWYDDH